MKYYFYYSIVIIENTLHLLLTKEFCLTCLKIKVVKIVTLYEGKVTINFFNVIFKIISKTI